MTLCLPLLAVPALNGCIEEAELVEELNLPACLTPSSATASIDRTDGHTVTFTWANSKGATQYLVEVYDGTDLYNADPEVLPETVFEQGTLAASEVKPAGVSGSTTSLKLELKTDVYYYARVKAQGMQADGKTRAIDDSKWQTFGYPIATYQVKPSVGKVEAVARTSTTVTLSWTMPEGDTEVDRIRVTPNPDPNDARAYKDYPIPEGTVKAGEMISFEVGTGADVVPLEASHFYTFAVHFGSANRGEITAWTRPDWSEATPVATVAELKNALNEAAAIPETPEDPVEPRQIKLTNTEVIYEIETIDVYAPVIIFGEEKDGKVPVVSGQFRLKPATSTTLGCTSFRLESLDLQQGTSSLNCIDINKADEGSAYTESTPVEIEVLNCRLSGYNKSAVYVSDDPVWFRSVLFDGCTFEELNTSQHLFDFRNGDIKKLIVRNSTFVNLAQRGVLNIKDNVTCSEVTFENNTLYKVGDPNAKDAAGIFNIKSEIGRFNIAGNVFASIDLAIVSSGTKTTPAVSSNFFYKIGETAWAPEGSDDNKVNEKGTGSLTQTAATAKGGAVLSSDPFENAERGLFYIDNALIEEAEAGDPRWLVPYIPEEVPPLTPVNDAEGFDAAGVYNWNLTDVETFYDEIDASTVRGNLEFFVKSNVISVSEDGMEFSAEAVLGANGVPVDGALAFLVTEPGSVVISTEASRSGTDNDHFSVACGPKDKSSLTAVAGAIPVGAKGARVAFPEITGETLIYIYPCGPIVLSALSWSSDATTLGPTPFDTPENFVLTAESAAQGSTDEVTLSWDSVAGAELYEVTVTGFDGSEKYQVETNSYTFKPSEMQADIYSFKVQVILADGDMVHEPSEIAEVDRKFSIIETLKPVSSDVTTVWGSKDFEWMYMTQSNHDGADFSTEWTSYVHNNLMYYADGTLKFNVSSNIYYWQFQGPSTTDKTDLDNAPHRRYMSFIAGGPGKLSVVMRSASSGKTGRYLMLRTGDTHPGDTKSATSYEAQDGDITAEWVLNDLAAGQYVTLYANDGIRIYSITWEPGMHAAEGQLETPVVTIDTPSVAAGTESVLLSWEAIEGAESYDVSIDNGAAVNVIQTTHTLETASLSAGEHTVSVIAKGAGKTDSFPGKAVLTIVGEGGLIPVTVATSWGADLFGELLAQYGTANVTDDIVYGNLSIIAGDGGKNKFGESSNAAGEKQARLQLGGTGKIDPKKQCVEFVAGGPGTLVIEVAGTNNSDDRTVSVYRNDTLVKGDVPALNTAKPVEITTIPISDASYGDTITILSNGSGVNIFSITWTPAQ